MPVFYETPDFVVAAHDQPHHSRENGGHIVITPRERFHHRHEMPFDLAAKLMHLTMLVGEAATIALTKRGIEVVRINYQDNGNWAYKEPQQEPKLHVHLYMRTWGEKHPRDDPKFQAFPDALVFPDRSTGFYEGFVALTDEDCAGIVSEIDELAQTKYRSLI